MDSIDLEVLTAAASWFAAGRRVLLVTVVKTWGSSPRPEGAMLAVRDDGLAAGSVSGGCIEDDIVERVRRNGVSGDGPALVRYGVSADEAHRFGLPCGGTIELVLEPVRAESRIDDLCAAVKAGRLVTRTLDLASGNARVDAADGATGVAIVDGRLIVPHGPRYRMLVIGAGQLSRYLCAMAAGLGYRITVCDPREQAFDAWDLPDTSLVRTMPDDTVIDMKLDAHSAVVTLTHDPKLDDLALMEALRTPAFYVGAIGSRRNNAARRERLREFDLSDTQVAHLRGPVGIFIGSRTPPEIAVSILAEVTAVKNGVAIPEIMAVAPAKRAREDLARVEDFGMAG